MRSLAAPEYDARSTFELCAKNVRDKEFRRRLESVADDIQTAEQTYKERAKDAVLFTIAEADNVAGIVAGDEMVTLYTGTFSRQKTPPRIIYDTIKSAPKQSICPLCAHRVVMTLDHYLAKSRHPALSVTPVNLVPACTDCNKIKPNTPPASASEQTLHPYFDNVDDEVWLVASVKEVEPAVVQFEAIPPATWNGIIGSRLRNHFRIFELGKLYSIQAAVELTNISDRLEKIAERGGPAGVRSHLQEEAGSRRSAAKNSWRAATYEALANSNWFCTVGFTAG
jgi:hypothetical protein